MAQIFTGFCAKDYDSQTGRCDPSDFFADIEEVFNPTSTSGTTGSKVFVLSNWLRLRFDNFDRSDSESESVAKVYAIVNNVEYLLFQTVSKYNRKVPQYELKYKIIVSSSGDVIFKISTNTYDAGGGDILNNQNVIFGYFAVENTITNNGGYGIYVPFSNGGSGDPFNPTPKYLLTADTTADLTNIGNMGSTTLAALQFIINDDAKITALTNLFANCSQCVTTQTFGMMIGNAYREGEAVLNGDTYYCVGGIAMYEGG